MKIVISGAGEVGFHLAKLLSNESQSIVVIDIDKEKLKKIESKMDVITIKGDATSFKVLRDAKVEEADIYISVTELQNTNLASALIAKKLGAKKTIARVTNPEYLYRENRIPIQRSGIDSIISPEQLAADEIVNLIEESVFNEVHEFEKGELILCGLKLDNEAQILNRTVKEVAELYQNEINFMPIAIIREEQGNKHKTIIPRSNTIYKLQDRVYFLTRKIARKEIYQLIGKKEMPLKEIIILGGGRIGKKTAIKLNELGLHVKIVERERKIAEELAEELNDIMIIHGDGRDGDLLVEEGIGEADVFVAVTGRSETNIMACLLAKTKGVKKTIALVENIDYIHLSQEAGISAFINKKLLAANSIFKFVRKGQVLDVTHLSDFDAEVLEYKVKEDCKIANKKIRDLNFPKEAIIGGIIRNNEGIIPNVDLVILPSDKIVIFTLPEALLQVEALFNKKKLFNF